MEVQGDGYGSDNLNRYTLTVKEELLFILEVQVNTMPKPLTPLMRVQEA